MSTAYTIINAMGVALGLLLASVPVLLLIWLMVEAVRTAIRIKRDNEYFKKHFDDTEYGEKREK